MRTHEMTRCCAVPRHPVDGGCSHRWRGHRVSQGASHGRQFLTPPPVGSVDGHAAGVLLVASRARRARSFTACSFVMRRGGWCMSLAPCPIRWMCPIGLSRSATIAGPFKHWMPRVRFVTLLDHEHSRLRRMRTEQPWVAPAELLARVPKEHPRLLFPKADLDTIRASLKTTRSEAFSGLKGSADRVLKLDVPPEPDYDKIKDPPSGVWPT